jgi:hypothetical protein
MISEYSCSCGFRTIFIHKFISHAKGCQVYKQREMEEYVPPPLLKNLGMEAG